MPDLKYTAARIEKYLADHGIGSILRRTSDGIGYIVAINKRPAMWVVVHINRITVWVNSSGQDVADADEAGALVVKRFQETEEE